ncbi:TetR/AcrR family transcriptional regulator C-terminal domain-containing protein [uncultured Ruminococcus sp.]|uniref:TetR/AcrR family transcriptional regulator C-terminal domain-containing protein n=1 Tax=uncultured Ruminococcus sp. TaxID=165186 RepID=UPI002627A86E|nr:TetR/AcrR family transcriptional regulator C-terminal domain-containing protein [uncultured Ruminococcus sp.]
MKRKTAKEILAESFRELAETVPIDKITIKDIVYNCDYSPATFYRHFKDKYDLIAFDYVQRTSEIMEKVGKNGYEWKDTLTDGMRFFDENRKYMKNLLLHTSGMDSFVRYFASANIKHLSNCILHNSEITELTSDLVIYVKVYVFGTVQTACEWLLGEIDCTPEHLAKLFENSVPEPLKKYLDIK